MDIKKINETVADVLQDDDVQDAIKEQVKMLLDQKTDDLEKQCEAYKKKIDQMAEARISSEVSKMQKVLEKYADAVVDDFIHEHEEDFRMYESSQKIETILEGLKAVMALAGIHATEVMEGVEIRAKKRDGVSTARVKGLQEQVEALHEQNKMLQKAASTRNKKFKALVENLDALQEENDDLSKNNNVLLKNNEELKSDNEELCRENQDLEKQCESLKKNLGLGRQKYENLQRANESLNKQNKSLSKENQDVVKMGVISELKTGLTLTESKKFEKVAESIPFSADRDYVRKLKEIRDGIQGSVLNEVTGEPSPKKQEKENTGYRRFL